MKSAQQKNTAIEHSHPSLFSISIFRIPEEFIALYLAIESPQNSVRQKGAKYLEQLLHRTKSAPIALTYTKEFLLVQNESEIQLSIIRFISQLSDLSAGKSMQSSLSFIIDNSSFLTELRHNLTHRVMVKGIVIERGREMILQELKDKYWKLMLEKIWKIYFIDENEVSRIFEKIANLTTNNNDQDQANDLSEIMKSSKIYGEYERCLSEQKNNKLTAEYLFNKCQSNYEFKSLIKPYIMKKVLPQIVDQTKNYITEEDIEIDLNEINQEVITQHFNLSSSGPSYNARSTILFSTMLEIMLSLHKYKSSSHCAKYRQTLSRISIILLKIFQKNNGKSQQGHKQTKKSQILSSTIILKKLGQVYLLNTIQQYKCILEALPQEVIQNIERFWNQKESQLGKQIIFSS